MKRVLLGLLLLPGLSRGAGVVGTGTPASCTESALGAALAGGGVVTFSCGGAPVTIPITATKTISAVTPTDVDGGGLVALDGQDAVRIFSVDYQRQLALRNLTLRRGRAADFGAAVRSQYHERGTSALTVVNVRFEGNVCTQPGDDVGGGALYILGGVSTVEGSTFVGNVGGNGGAIGYLGGNDEGPANGLTVRDSLFVGNATHGHAGQNGGAGGALYVDGSGDGEVRIERCTFRENVAWGGGAIQSVMYGSPQALVIADSTFLENRATGANAGAIYHQGGALTFTGSLVAGNRAFNQGGGLWLFKPTTAAITNVTFTGNRVEGGVPPDDWAVGGGLSIYPSETSSVVLSHLTVVRNHAWWTGGGITVNNEHAGRVTLRASIVAWNTAYNGGNAWDIGKNCASEPGMMLNGGDVLEFPRRNLGAVNDFDCVASPLIVDPLPGPLADHGGLVETVSLLPGSPAVDGALSGCWAAVDARGAARPAGVRCDVGAFEGTESPVRFHTVVPCRVLDTRNGAGTPVAANGTLGFDAAGLCGTPADARALAVNLTDVSPGADGVLRLFGAGSGTPSAHVLAFRAGRTRASNAVAVPGALGRLTVKNESAQPVHVILDVSGYFR